MKAYESAPSPDLTDTDPGIAAGSGATAVRSLRRPGCSAAPRYSPAPSGAGLHRHSSITLFGGFLRFYRLSQPNAVVFDETYYVLDGANSILHHGVELNHVKNVNQLLLQGNPNIFQKSYSAAVCYPHKVPCLTGEVVAHPPLGKIMMALGQWTFGLTPFGWRFTVAVIGTVSILMVARDLRAG